MGFSNLGMNVMMKCASLICVLCLLQLVNGKCGCGDGMLYSGLVWRRPPILKAKGRRLQTNPGLEECYNVFMIYV